MVQKHESTDPVLAPNYNLHPFQPGEKNLSHAGHSIDGHADLKGSGAFAAILKGDVARHLTVFEKKAALINA